MGIFLKMSSAFSHIVFPFQISRKWFFLVAHGGPLWRVFFSKILITLDVLSTFFTRPLTECYFSERFPISAGATNLIQKKIVFPVNIDIQNESFVFLIIIGV